MWECVHLVLQAPRVHAVPCHPQAVELKATKVCHIGTCDAATYPIAKKKTSYEFLREKMHLRPRTNTIGAVARIRNALAYATHKFFQESGFLYVHTPIITASDCEGAGEMFQVGSLSLGQSCMFCAQTSKCNLCVHLCAYRTTAHCDYPALACRCLVL